MKIKFHAPRQTWPYLFAIAWMVLTVAATGIYTSCQRTAAGPVESGAQEPDPEKLVEAALTAGRLAGELGLEVAVDQVDLEGCVAAAAAVAILEASADVWFEVRHETTRPDGQLELGDVVVDASACIPLGLVPPPAPPEPALDPIQLVVQLVRVGIAAALPTVCAEGQEACDRLLVAAAVTAHVEVVVERTLWELRDEAGDVDGVVVVTLPPLQIARR